MAREFLFHLLTAGPALYHEGACGAVGLAALCFHPGSEGWTAVVVVALGHGIWRDCHRVQIVSVFVSSP